MNTLFVFSFCSAARAVPALEAAGRFLGLRCEYLLGQSYCENPSKYNRHVLFVVLSKESLENPALRTQISDALKSCDQSPRFCVIEGIDGSLDTQLKYRDFYLEFDDILFSPCDAVEVITRFKQVEADTLTTTTESHDSLVDEFTQFNLVGKSPVFLDTLFLIKKVSKCTAPVLIQGETGTGKENAARAIHYLSARKDKAFVPVNCAALPNELLESELFGHEKGAFTDAKTTQPGLVEIASGGTLFLDEVDSLSGKAQTLLLRFLQSQEYRAVGGRTLKYSDVRIVTATNVDLERKVEEQEFRRDLYYRLNVLNVQMPALRERGKDIALIAKSFIRKFSSVHDTPEKNLTRSSVRWLLRQPWPGNVRELENFIVRQLVLNDGENISVIDSSDDGEYAFSLENETAPTPEVADKTFKDAKADAIVEFERRYLQEVLKKTEGNVSKAARISGKERRALGKLLKKYNINREQFLSSCPM